MKPDKQARKKISIPSPFNNNNNPITGVTHQVHTITGTADKAHIADSVKSAELSKRNTPMHEVDGHKVDSSEPAVDATNKLVDGRSQVLVLLDILP